MNKLSKHKAVLLPFCVVFVGLMSPGFPEAGDASQSLRSGIKLNGDYKVKSSREALEIVQNEYKSRGPRIRVGSNPDYFSYFGLVSLPFEVRDFSQSNDLLFLFKLAQIGDNIAEHSGTTSIAQAWVNPKSGKCLFFDAPWLMKAPKDVDGEVLANP